LVHSALIERGPDRRAKCEDRVTGTAPKVYRGPAEESGEYRFHSEALANRERLLQGLKGARRLLAKRSSDVATATQTLRILIIDDDVHVLSFVTETLSAEGYDVQTAIDGAHALQKLATADLPYHLLIVDGRMPNLDGWKFIVQARAGGFKGRIIVFSAYLDVDEHRRYRELSIDRVIEKPPRSGELVNAVREIAELAL
jgi:CheY-like chemotaxis protein